MTFAPGIVHAVDPGRLRLLVEVGRRGSVSAAAEACMISQPSATKHIKTLEAALGERLIARNGRASTLTEAGRVVAAHGAGVLDTLGRMEEELRALRDAETGTLTLAASNTSGTYVVPTLLECFAERHPRVDVDISIGASAWVAERVRRREVSIGIAGEIELGEGVRAEPFLDDELLGIAAPGTVPLRRGKVSPAELERQTLLVRELGSSTRAVADRHLARAGVRPAKRWELDSDEAIKRTVRAGLGFGFLSELVVAEEIERDELLAFRVDGAAPMRRSINLLLPDDRDLTPAERAFVVTLSECCDTTIAGCAVDDRSC